MRTFLLLNAQNLRTSIDKNAQILYYLHVVYMNELKEIRKSLNISQIDAANLLKVSRRTYQKYESLNDFDDEKYKYYVHRFKDLLLVDEENGIITIDFIKKTVTKVFEHYDIKICYLFGSYTKGKAKGTSDVDLLIDSEITGLNFYGLVEELRENLHKKVDLLTLDSIRENSKLLVEILKDGIRIY